MNSPLKILKKYWKHQSFRKPQEEIINTVLNKENTIALLPTGGGKSICFQIPAIILDGICVVISPLIALIQDQIEGLQKRGLKATTIPSGSSQDEIITLFDNLKFGGITFLYLSPERLQSKFIQEKIKELHISLIAVDEAHCISEWGHDFRPSYRNITILKKIKPKAKVIALTATATQKVIDDIAENLELTSPRIFKKSFRREKLAYQIFTVEDKLYKLIQIFTKTKSSAIVYVNSRNKAIQISNFLNANKFKSSFYHGGLSFIEKKLAFDNWLTEKSPIMVATNAFGMGIDKANVGIVVHFDFPYSIENYVQEAGRAGRNGKKAFAVLLQNANDIRIFKEQTEASLPTISEIKEVLNNLYQHFYIAKGELISEPFNFSFLEFCKKYNLTSRKTATVLVILRNNGIIELTNNFNKRSTVKFNINTKEFIRNNSKKLLINSLLRSYGGLFEQETKIDEFSLAKKAGVTSKQVIANLQRLHTEDVLTYKQAISNSNLTFLLPREGHKTINTRAKEIEQFLHQKKKKAIDIIKFITNDTVCRNIQLLSYFNEKDAQNCKICDVCLSKKKNKSFLFSSEILKIIQQKAISSKEICMLLPANEQDILVHLRQLLSDEKIGLNSQNKFYVR